MMLTVRYNVSGTSLNFRWTSTSQSTKIALMRSLTYELYVEVVREFNVLLLETRSLMEIARF